MLGVEGGKKRNSNLHGHIARNNYLSRIVFDSYIACLAMVRMSRSVLSTYELKGMGLLWDTIHVSVEEQVATFLHTGGHNVKHRVIGLNFL